MKLTRVPRSGFHEEISSHITVACDIDVRWAYRGDRGFHLIGLVVRSVWL